MENLLNKFLVIGRVKGNKAPFLFRFLNLVMHVLILGRTGSGKTNLIYWIVAQCIRKMIPVWVFDSNKNEFRHLIRLFPGLLVIQLGKNFKINPLAVPFRVDPKQWAQIFVDTFCRVHSLLDGSEALLLRLVMELYHEFGVFKNPGVFPTLEDLYLKCRAQNFPKYSRPSSYQASINNRLEIYLSMHPEMFDCSVGFPLDELSKKSVVFELTGLPEKLSTFLISIILFWLFNFRIALQERGVGLRNLVVLDECKWIFPPFINENIGWPPITYILAQIREFGVGILASDQTANLNESIFVNSFLKICMSMGSGKDLEKVAKMFSLNRDQVDYMHRLRVGEAVVGYPLIEEPFVIQVPEFPLH